METRKSVHMLTAVSAFWLIFSGLGTNYWKDNFSPRVLFVSATRKQGHGRRLCWGWTKSQWWMERLSSEHPGLFATNSLCVQRTFTKHLLRAGTGWTVWRALQAWPLRSHGPHGPAVPISRCRDAAGSWMRTLEGLGRSLGSKWRSGCAREMSTLERRRVPFSSFPPQEQRPAWLLNDALHFFWF